MMRLLHLSVARCLAYREKCVLVSGTSPLLPYCCKLTFFFFNTSLESVTFEAVIRNLALLERCQGDQVRRVWVTSTRRWGRV